MPDAAVAEPQPRRRKPRARAPTTPDPIEIAMEAQASGKPAEGAAYDLLVEQRRLVGVQIASERVGLALKAMTGLVGLAVVALLAGMAWNAAHDQSVVVRAFSTPPAYNARGLTGEVLAGRFMDDLILIRTRTERVSLAPSQDLRAAGEDIRIDIPQTGVSVGEIERLFDRWLARQIVISGAIIEEESGALTLNARVGGNGWVRVSGPPDQLDGLLLQLAEKSFAAYRPDQWVVYLGSENRYDESLAAAKANVVNNPDRGVVLARDYSIWAGREGDPARQVELFRKAISISPRQMVFRRNIARAYDRLGDEQAAFDAGKMALALRGSDQPQLIEQRKAVMEKLRRNARYLTTSLSGAYADALPFADPGVEESVAAARAHDGVTARRIVSDALEVEKMTPAAAAFTRVRVAEAAGDWPAMAAGMGAYAAAREGAFNAPPGPGLTPAAQSPVGQAQYAALRARRDDPLLAKALACTGDIEEARAVAAATPLDCAACLRARAEVESAARDWRAADGWYARAAAFAPRLPQAETAWGASMLARGDTAGAIAKLAAASVKGPRFADPLELWGEALMAKGDAKAAAARFAQAARLAPRWGRLHLKWGEALAAQGRADEARAEWRAALGMDMSPADRARLAQLLARR